MSKQDFAEKAFELTKLLRKESVPDEFVAIYEDEQNLLLFSTDKISVCVMDGAVEAGHVDLIAKILAMLSPNKGKLN